MKSNRPPRSSSTASGDGIGAWNYLWLVPLFVSCFVSMFWAPMGVVWVPLNIYGLYKRRGWARISTLLYAVIALFSCAGTPYAVYALYSLTRRETRELFNN